MVLADKEGLSRATIRFIWENPLSRSLEEIAIVLTTPNPRQYLGCFYSEFQMFSGGSNGFCFIELKASCQCVQRKCCPLNLLANSLNPELFYILIVLYFFKQSFLKRNFKLIIEMLVAVSYFHHKRLSHNLSILEKDAYTHSSVPKDPAFLHAEQPLLPS